MELICVLLTLFAGGIERSFFLTGVVLIFYHLDNFCDDLTYWLKNHTEQAHELWQSLTRLGNNLRQTTVNTHV